MFLEVFSTFFEAIFALCFLFFLILKPIFKHSESYCFSPGVNS